MYPLPCCFPEFLYFYQLFLIFLVFLDIVLFLPVLLLTCGMMGLKIKSGRAQCLPPKVWGGSRCIFCLLVLLNFFIFFNYSWYFLIFLNEILALRSFYYNALVELRQDGFCFKERERGWRGGRSASQDLDVPCALFLILCWFRCCCNSYIFYVWLCCP